MEQAGAHKYTEHTVESGQSNMNTYIMQSNAQTMSSQFNVQLNCHLLTQARKELNMTFAVIHYTVEIFLLC